MGAIIEGRMACLSSCHHVIHSCQPTSSRCRLVNRTPFLSQPIRREEGRLPEGRIRNLTARFRMETATKKRPRDGGEETSRARGRGEEVVRDEERDRSVTDDEVEEFFAILRRMREAAVSLPDKGGNGGVRSRAAAAERMSIWRPRFQREDFEDTSSVGDNGRPRGTEEVPSGGELAAEERVAENTISVGRLDLNADPAPEGLGLESLTADSTAPVAS